MTVATFTGAMHSMCCPCWWRRHHRRHGIVRPSIRYDTLPWDAVIDIPGMWNAVQGISRPDTPVLLFCQHPFTSLLGSSNLRRLRYAWVWEKTQATGFLNAGRMPMKAHEDILVFYDRLPKYHPIKTDGHRRKVVMAEHQRKCDAGEEYPEARQFPGLHIHGRYPRVLKFKTDKQRSCLHATQKPVALLEYLIRTYTDEGDIVLDFAMGSGSRPVACRNTGRRFVGVEIDREIFQHSTKPYNPWLTPGEIWVDIKNYEGKYRISNLGRVKSLERQVSHDGITWIQPERIMCHWCGTTSLYDCVRLYKGGVGKKFSVHRLVAQHFLPDWNPGLEVNHIDGNRDNNRADNLDMCTHQRNIEHAIAGGLGKRDHGEKSVNAKLTNGQAEEIQW